MHMERSTPDTQILTKLIRNVTQIGFIKGILDYIALHCADVHNLAMHK